MHNDGSAAGKLSELHVFRRELTEIIRFMIACSNQRMTGAFSICGMTLYSCYVCSTFIGFQSCRSQKIVE